MTDAFTVGLKAWAGTTVFEFSDGLRIRITEFDAMRTKQKSTSPFLRDVKGIPPLAMRALERAGLETLGDFLRHCETLALGLNFLAALRMIAGVTNDDILPANNAITGAWAKAKCEQDAARNGVHSTSAPEAQAPAPPAGGHAPDADPDEILRVPLKSIAANPLNPRKTFDETKLAELAASIAQKGVLQPIIVRPHPQAGATANVSYQLVAGERRLRAAATAGLKVIPCIVKHLDDRACLEVMVVENEQRDDVRAMEKADGYWQLTKLGLSIEEIAKRVGTSVSTIRNALKLRDLPELAREAVDAGRLAPSIAGLIARIPGESMRARAAAHILAGNTYGWIDAKAPKPKPTDEPLTFRQAKEEIEEHCMVELKSATFDRKSLDLLPGFATSCDACPKRVGNLQTRDPEHWKGTRADVCTDPDCFRAKRDAWNARLLAAAKAKGQAVLSAKAAAEEFRYGTIQYDSQFVDVGRLSAKEAAKIDESKIVLATDRSGNLRRLAKKTDAPAASNGRLHQRAATRPRKTAEERLDEQVEREATREQLAELAEKAADHFPIPTRPQNCAILRHMIGESLGWGAVRDQVLARHQCAGRTTIEKIQSLEKLLGTLDAPALFALLVEFVCGPEATGSPKYQYHRSGTEDLAGVLGLTARKDVEKRVRARLTESSKKPSANGKPGASACANRRR